MVNFGLKKYCDGMDMLEQVLKPINHINSQMKYDIIIIGAGAAGLMAMNELLEAGLHVCLLEATAIAGGRIATVHKTGFDQPFETGAEFIHGQLPLTLSLLNKAGIDYIPVAGKMINIHGKKWHKNEAHEKHWETFMRQLNKLKADTTIGQFLQENFSGDKYAGLREAVQQFAEGFDLADISKASAKAAYREWSHEDKNYRIPGGYARLIDYLVTKGSHQNGHIHFNTCADKIEYNKENVTIHTTDNRHFEASVALITVSAGVLQSGDIEFVPAFEPHYGNAIQQLGFGSVIKILLQFKTSFWSEYYDDIGFLLSDEPIPTWWTQLPAENNLLTGWLGGPAAAVKSAETDASLLQSAIVSLSNIFNLKAEVLQKDLVHYTISNWQNHPYIKGGYSYVSIDSTNAKKILSHPAGGSIFFAGEALCNGGSQGTVEAALQSGHEVAKQIKDYLD